MAQHFKDLIVWQKAMDLVADVYRITDSFPKREIYSLTDQIRRAAVSVPSNIAEDKPTTTQASLFTFSVTRMARLPNWRLRSCWPSVWSMLEASKSRVC